MHRGLPVNFMRVVSLLLLGLLSSVFALSLRADVTLAPLFTDHAVLQREKPVPVWGRADAGEKITVNFSGQSEHTTAGPDGRWEIYLEAMPANREGADLIVAGKNTVTVHDIVVGEVWLCSGQSNMEFTVSHAANAPEEIASAHFPLIRHVRISHAVATAPAETVKTSGWLSASPETVGGFTAVGYFFARDIFQKLGVPIGLIHSSWGGTPIESWMSPATLASDPAFKIVLERWEKDLADYPEKKKAYDAKFGDWRKAEAAAKAQGEAAHVAFLKQRPYQRAPRGPGDSWTPSGLFNGMINPLLPYGIRGALWYQGESNFDRASEYHALFAAMITAWRRHFGQGDFPFYWVSLANFRSDEDPTGLTYAFLREAQTQTLSLPNTGQALAIDIGDADNIHPTNKQKVGHRLARLAKNRVYGITTDDTGPTFASASPEGAALRVRFTHAASGLIAREKPVQSLEIAGTDRKFHPALGKIEHDTLLVSAPQVREPVAVRYAWRNLPEANLYNGAGLPAVPFRSDSW
jgi:sialate O-acetylesterase